MVVALLGDESSSVCPPIGFDKSWIALECSADLRVVITIVGLLLQSVCSSDLPLQPTKTTKTKARHLIIKYFIYLTQFLLKFYTSSLI